MAHQNILYIRQGRIQGRSLGALEPPTIPFGSLSRFPGGGGKKRERNPGLYNHITEN